MTGPFIAMLTAHRHILSRGGVVAPSQLSRTVHRGARALIDRGFARVDQDGRVALKGYGR